MPQGVIEPAGGEILCSIAGGGREARFSAAEAEAELRQWAKRYDAATCVDNEGELSAIGPEMFTWLDEKGSASAWAEGAGDRRLEIAVSGGRNDVETALLDAPWELLSRTTGPLALDDVQLFIVARRIGPGETPVVPRFADLQVMFMAAAPQNETTLDFEGEQPHRQAPRRLRAF
jgi:hypothetical protein